MGANNVHLRYGLKGRTTKTMTLESAFVKISWPWSTRTSEAKVIAQSRELGQHDNRILDHLPTVLGDQDFDEYSTKRIKVLLGLPQATKDAYRQLRIIAFKPLVPITNTKGDEFWQAFLEITRCA
jgi:hypothetical protein